MTAARGAGLPNRRSDLALGEQEMDEHLQRTLRRTSVMRQGFYLVVLVVALAGQVSGAVETLRIPLAAAVPAVAALELGGVVVLANADVRRRLGEQAVASRLLSVAIAAGAVAFNWLAHDNHLLGGFFAGMSALGYLVWLMHTENQRRDRLRAKGDLPPTTPGYEVVGHWLRHPWLTSRAKTMAKADPGLGLYDSLAAARAEIRRERRQSAISKVLHRKIRAAVDPNTADIAIAVYDLDEIASRLADGADYDGLTALIAADLTPARLGLNTTGLNNADVDTTDPDATGLDAAMNGAQKADAEKPGAPNAAVPGTSAPTTAVPTTAAQAAGVPATGAQVPDERDAADAGRGATSPEAAPEEATAVPGPARVATAIDSPTVESPIVGGVLRAPTRAVARAQPASILDPSIRRSLEDLGLGRQAEPAASGTPGEQPPTRRERSRRTAGAQRGTTTTTTTAPAVESRPATATGPLSDTLPAGPTPGGSANGGRPARDGSLRTRVHTVLDARVRPGDERDESTLVQLVADELDLSDVDRLTAVNYVHSWATEGSRVAVPAGGSS